MIQKLTQTHKFLVKAYLLAYLFNCLFSACDWTGSVCEVNIDECSMQLTESGEPTSACLNNATCIDLINSYRCECNVGFTGLLSSCGNLVCVAATQCDQSVSQSINNREFLEWPKYLKQCKFCIDTKMSDQPNGRI